MVEPESRSAPCIEVQNGFPFPDASQVANSLLLQPSFPNFVNTHIHAGCFSGGDKTREGEKNVASIPSSHGARQHLDEIRVDPIFDPSSLPPSNPQQLAFTFQRSPRIRNANSDATTNSAHSPLLIIEFLLVGYVCNECVEKSVQKFSRVLFRNFEGNLSVYTINRVS